MDKKNNILITGASGFIGKHLLSKLKNEFKNIACIDLFFNKTFLYKYKNAVQLFTGNLLDKKFINTCINEFNPEYVFHLAGSKTRTNSFQEYKTSYDINYLGTLNLFESLVNRIDLKLVTTIGTIDEYGSALSPFKENSQELPNSAYGLSKLSATKLALILNRQFKLPVVVLRPSIAYGPGQGDEMFIPGLIKTLLRKEPFMMTEGKQLRDFIYIEDLTDAIIQGLYCKDLEGHIINIASGTSICIRDLAMQIAEVTNNIEFLKIGEIPYRASEIMNYVVDITKASILLKWYPKTKFSDGLGKTISFYRKNLTNEA